jgi:type III restriction enzyme
VNLIHSQMQQHFVESTDGYEAHVTRGFHTLRANNYSAAADEDVRNFRVAVPDGQRNRIGSMVFGGFRKCLYPIQKFDSDPERRFAGILENDGDVVKWFKPAKGDFQIHHSHEESYEPDFVVETKTGKLLCEPKRANEMTDEVVLAKANAAATWCKHASDHANENGGKPWSYLLLPHDQIQDQMTVAGLTARFEVWAKD